MQLHMPELQKLLTTVQVVLATSGAIADADSTAAVTKRDAIKHRQLSGMALWGMLRCAANECPSVSWAGRDASAALAHPSSAAALEQPSFFQGCTERGGLQLAPMLTPCHDCGHQDLLGSLDHVHCGSSLHVQMQAFLYNFKWEPTRCCNDSRTLSSSVCHSGEIASLCLAHLWGRGGTGQPHGVLAGSLFWHSRQLLPSGQGWALLARAVCSTA